MANQKSRKKVLRERMDIVRQTGRPQTIVERRRGFQVGPFELGGGTVETRITPRAFGPPQVMERKLKKNQKRRTRSS